MIWLAAFLLTCIVGIALYTVYEKPSRSKEGEKLKSQYSIVYVKGEYGWGDHLQGMFHLWMYCQRHGIQFQIEKDPLWKLFDSQVYTEVSKKVKDTRLQVVNQHTPDYDLLKALKPDQLTAIVTNSAFCRWDNQKEYFKAWKTFWSTILIPSDSLVELVSPMVAECRSAAHFRFGDIDFFDGAHCFITNPEKVKQSFTSLKLPKPTYVASDHWTFLKDIKGCKTWKDYYPETDIQHTMKSENNRSIVESMLFYYLPTVAICQWSNFSRIPALSTEDHKVHMLTHDYIYTPIKEPHHYVEK